MSISLGINRTTDASIALISGSSAPLLLRKERITRKKHDRGALGDMASYSNWLSCRDPIDVVVECFSADRERSLREQYWKEVAETFSIGPDTKRVEISHHYAHALLADLAGVERAAVLVADHHGSPINLITDSPISADHEGQGPVEVISTFLFDKARLKSLSRQSWDMEDATLGGLGAFYSAVTDVLFPGKGYGYEGVVMGLAPFGDRKRLNLPRLSVSGASVATPPGWLELLYDKSATKRFSLRDGSMRAAADLAAAAQWVFEEALLEVASNLKSLADTETLVYVGGCALNCSANGRLINEGPFKSVFIPPACDDAGTALGCAIYGRKLVDPTSCIERIETDFSGPFHICDERQIREACMRAGHEVLAPPNLAAEVAARIERGATVAMWQGRSEFGPRALGNRSILADPRFEVSKWYINSKIKGRQWFRPLAPMVLEHEAGRIFGGGGDSRFMTQKRSVRPEYVKKLQAVTHIDESSRIQTVTREQNDLIYRIICEYDKLTGIPVILNTSLNGTDEPIVESPKEALDLFERSPIHHLVIPPLLISKRPALPSMYSS